MVTLKGYISDRLANIFDRFKNHILKYMIK